MDDLIDDIAEDVEDSFSLDFKDPYQEPYGNPEKTTPTQRKSWNYLKEGVWRQASIGAKGSGKGQPLDEPVLTPDGWVPMGDIDTGSVVITQSGEPTLVNGVYPQGKRPVYRVTFNDGSSTRTDDQHLWSVRTGSMKYRGKGFEKIKTTPELMCDLKTSQGYNKWQIPTVNAVHFTESSNLPIPPYALGALIGDGTFVAHTPRITSSDKAIARRVAREVGAELTDYRGEYDYGLKNGGRLRSQLVELGLEGLNSGQKFIPEPYLRASVEDRKKLVRGLMDTDGTVGTSTGSFSTVSRQLADDFRDLVRSLGVVTKVRSRSTNGGRSYAYRVSVNADFNPFWIDRKHEEYNEEAGQGDVKTIDSIEYVGEEPTQCISVADASSLYVTSGYTVTHNSYGGAAFSFYFGQKYPGCTGACVASTSRQAKDAAGEHFVNMADMLGYDCEYFGSKKIHGQQYSRFYVVDLDGEGYNEGMIFKLFVRSMESVDSMEGSEIDFIWFEELQQADKQPFVTAESRNRGTTITDGEKDNPVYLAGMTAGREHWMYRMLEENMGFVTEDEFDPDEDRAVLFEPVLTENEQNLGDNTIDKYYRMFDETKAERLIHANRVSKNSDRALHAYRDRIHTSGVMSNVLCHYSPYQDLILSFDFNVSPMCVSAWQEKDWNDQWRADNVQIIWNDAETRIQEVRVWDEMETNENVDAEELGYTSYDSLEEWKEPDTTALAQVDEWEVWPDDSKGGGTRGVMKHIVEDYAEKQAASVTILGDARGNNKQSSSVKTDWDIIREYASQFNETDIIPGLRSNKVTGQDVKWSNPPVKDTLNNANSVLMNGEGQARMCFMMETKYPSGGVSSSVSATETGPNGKIDEKRDRSDDREKPRTHFLDTVRYVCWWFTEGAFMSVDAFEDALDEMEEMQARNQGIATPDGEDPDRYRGFPDEEQGTAPLEFGDDTDLMF